MPRPNANDLMSISAQDMARLDALIGTWSSVYADVARALFTGLLNSDAVKTPAATAAALVVAQVHALARQMGGAQFYLGAHVIRHGRDDMERRNSRIRAKFNGRNFAELAREFDLTDATVRKLMNKKPAAKIETAH